MAKRKTRARAKTKPRKADTRWLSEIKSGRRHREDFGDLVGLARSINNLGGLLHPVVIDAENKLIAGERRCRAWKLSNFADQPIPVHVVEVDFIAAGEWDENIIRKDFTPSEAVALRQEIVKRLRPAARERMRTRSKDVAPTPKGNASDQASQLIGFDRRTIDKAEAVVAAATENPKRFGKLKEDMDSTNKVNGPYKRLQIMRQTDALKKKPAVLPGRGPYNVMVIDYPWPSEKDADQASIDERGRAMRKYPEMAIDKGIAFFESKTFQDLLAKDLVIYFWSTNHHLDQAFNLLRAIGFKTKRLRASAHSTVGTWIKNKMGRGAVLRGQTEHCIIATRGKPVIDLTNQTTAWQGKGWEVREDSRKPDAFFDLVERLTPAARFAEIFSRGGRGPKWDCYGDQANRFEPRAEPEKKNKSRAAPRAAAAGRGAAAKSPAGGDAPADPAGEGAADPNQIEFHGFGAPSPAPATQEV